MAATKWWIGNALDVADVYYVVPTSPNVGDTFTLTINEKDLTYTVPTTGATAAAVVDAIVILVNDSDIPEWTEVGAEAATVLISGVATYAVVLTGRTKGQPITITASTSSSSTFSVVITEVRKGAAATNEKQTVQLAGVPTGGTFTLSFEGQTTAALAWDISAAALDTAFELLTSVDTVTVTRTGAGTVASPYIWTIEFTGTHAGVDVGAITGDGTLLTGITGAQYLTHATTTQGAPAQNEKQRVAFTTGATGTGTFSLNCSDAVVFLGVSGFVAVNSGVFTAADLKTALETRYGIGNVVVTQESTISCLIEWVGAYAGINILPLTFASQPSSTGTITQVQAGSSTPVNEVQTVKVNHAPTGGTYTLTFQGATTAAIAYNASAATVQTELEALANIAVGDVTVTRAGSGTIADPYIYTVTFLVTYAGVDVAQLTSTSSLTGCGVKTATSQAAVAAVNEQQSITLSPTPTGGTFTLTSHQAETTAAIAYNASAATLLAALEALATPVPGDFTVTGPAGGPWVVEFTGVYAAADIALWTGSGASLTGTAGQTWTLTHPTTATGKSFFDNVDNWSDGIVPVSTDTLYFANTNVPLLYAISQAAITLAAVHIEASYTGQIGLPDRSGLGYYEYRGKEWAISITALTIGAGAGDGCSFMRINVGSAANTTLVYGTGSPSNDYPVALMLKGTNAANILRCYKGLIGLAYFQTEVATFATIELGNEGNVETDVTFIGGAGLTIGTSLSKWGGEATLNAACPTILNVGGTLTMVGTGGASGTFRLQEGLCVWRSTGTIGTLIIAAGGTFDKTHDSRGQTITTCQMHAQSALYDSTRSITFTNPLQLVQCSLEDVKLDLGTNISLAPASL